MLLVILTALLAASTTTVGAAPTVNDAPHDADTDKRMSQLIEIHRPFLTSTEQLRSFQRKLRGGYGFGPGRGDGSDGGGAGDGGGYGYGHGHGHGGGHHGGWWDDEEGQPGAGWGGGGGGGHMQTIHYLFDNVDTIQRDVKELNMVDGQSVGVKATTTSTNPDVTEALRQHVQDMSELISRGGFIRRMDPLFNEISTHYRDIHLKKLDVENGVQVLHAGSTKCAGELVRRHSEAISGFVSRGRTELWHFNAVPGICRRDEGSERTGFIGFDEDQDSLVVGGAVAVGGQDTTDTTEELYEGAQDSETTVIEPEMTGNEADSKVMADPNTVAFTPIEEQQQEEMPGEGGGSFAPAIPGVSWTILFGLLSVLFSLVGE